MKSEDVLLSLVNEIQNTYSDTEKHWCEYAKNNNLALFNQKKVRVQECNAGFEYLDLIEKYLAFLTTSNLEHQFRRFGDNYRIDSRIKARNSVEEKLDAYSKTGQDFNVNKCLNDLFGIRIIIDDLLSFDSIQALFSGNHDLKCLDSSKPKESATKEYIAMHIYFKSEGNKHFQWELQIWMARDEIMNQISHKGHRFKYTKWEGSKG